MKVDDDRTDVDPLARLERTDRMGAEPFANASPVAAAPSVVAAASATSAPATAPTPSASAMFPAPVASPPVASPPVASVAPPADRLGAIPGSYPPPPNIGPPVAAIPGGYPPPPGFGPHAAPARAGSYGLGVETVGSGYGPPPAGAGYSSPPQVGVTPPGVVPDAPVKLSAFGEIRAVVGDFVKRNEKFIWWLHTAYALSLGAFVATFASKGFERARMLTLSLTAAWVLVVFFFRFFGTGARQDFMTAWPGMRRRFFVMSYMMKNLFQGMLFYLLPFYWKSSSYDAKTYVVFVGLAACAIVSTLDLVFDRVLLRFKSVASGFFATTLFGCTNLVIPALLPNTPVIVSLLVAAGLAVATFLLFHLSIERLRRPAALAGFAAAVGLGVIGVYLGREHVPPVPLTLRSAGVGPALGSDGALALELRSIREAELAGDKGQLYAVTDVAVIGNGEHFRHVWRRGEKEIAHTTAEAAPTKEPGVVRVASKVAADAWPTEPKGVYTVDVITDSDQIVGRVVFEIK